MVHLNDFNGNIDAFQLVVLFGAEQNVNLIKRLKRSNKRPLLKDTNIEVTLKELDTQRRKYYLNADIRIRNANSINKTYLNFIEMFSKLNEKNNKN